MKEFDLKAALNGEPVMLRDGSKAIVLNDLRKHFINAKDSDDVLLGAIYGDDGNTLRRSACWCCSGLWNYDYIDEFDIIGMWEEPKKQINIEDLPKPFKPKDGESYFYINGGSVDYEHEFWDTNNFDITAAERGNCFRTREDAQKWLDFMKGMLE